MLKWISKGEPEKFVAEVRTRIGKKESITPSDDVYAQLEKLAALKDKRVITVSEYEQKKALLLRRI